MKVNFVAQSIRRLASVALVTLSATLQASELEIGWAERDITPELGGKKVGLAGLYYLREATNVQSRLKFTCCVMRQGDEQVLMGSVDSVSGWEPFTVRVSSSMRPVPRR